MLSSCFRFLEYYNQNLIIRTSIIVNRYIVIYLTLSTDINKTEYPHYQDKCLLLTPFTLSFGTLFSMKLYFNSVNVPLNDA